MTSPIFINLLAVLMLPLQSVSNNTISGHVSNDQHVPVKELRVELMNEVDTVISTVKTDGSGLFVVHKLSYGTLQVRVQTAGTNYVSQTKRVDLARPTGFGVATEEVDFVLSPIKSNPGSVAKPGVIFVQEVPEAARKQYQKAIDLLDKSNRRQEAFAALKSAVEIFPQYFDALEMLGTEQVRDQQYEAAIPVLTKALEVNSKAYASCFVLGVAQYHLKQLQPAIESLRRALLLNEKSINANLWLGIALRQTSRPEDAEAYLKRADALADSKVPDDQRQPALLFNQLKRYKEAADELEIFLKVEPDARDAEQIKKLIQRLRERSRG